MGGRGGSFGSGGGTYHQFSDVPIDGYQFGGDGADVVNFFSSNSNYSELMDSMTFDERNHFRMWASGDFMFGQQYRGWDSMTRDEKEATATFDKYLDQSELREGIVLARNSDAQLILGKGSKTGSLSEYSAMEGQLVISKGSMSCAAAAEGLDIGSGYNKTVTYKIHIPKSKGAGMWIGDKRVNGWGAIQREFMTNRDAIFRVGKTTMEYGHATVELFYEGHTAHDYGKKGRA